MLFDVYGVSNWAESEGEQFAIFEKREFKSEAEAVQAAKAAYSQDLEVVAIALNN